MFKKRIKKTYLKRSDRFKKNARSKGGVLLRMFSHHSWYGNKSTKFKARKNLKNPYKSFQISATFYEKVRNKYFLKLVLIGWIILLYLLFFSNFFQIKYLDYSGLENIKKEVFAEKLDNFLHKRKYFILPNNNLFVFDSKSFTEYFSKEYSIDYFEVKKNYLDRAVKIKIRERAPVLYLSTGDKIYLIDSLGFAVSSTLEMEESYPVVYNSIPALYQQVLIGEQIIPESLVDSILLMKNRIPLETNIKIISFQIKNTEKFTLTPKENKIADDLNNEDSPISKESKNIESSEPSNSDNEKNSDLIRNYPPKEEYDFKIDKFKNYYYPELSVITNKGWEIYFGNEPFKNSTTVDKQITNLTVLFSKNSDLLKSKLSYIDLRILSKIFYK